MNKQTNLSEHFTLGELTKTKVELENVPNEEQVNNLKRLCRWLEQKRNVIWIHFAVRPSSNRRRTNFKR